MAPPRESHYGLSPEHKLMIKKKFTLLYNSELKFFLTIFLGKLNNQWGLWVKSVGNFN